MNLLINQTEDYYHRSPELIEKNFECQLDKHNSACPRCNANLLSVLFVERGEGIKFDIAKNTVATEDCFALTCNCCAYEWLQTCKKEINEKDDGIPF